MAPVHLRFANCVIGQQTIFTKIYECPICRCENVELIPLNLDEKYEYHIDQNKGLEVKFSTGFLLIYNLLNMTK
jgi:hypothetical protein